MADKNADRLGNLFHEKAIFVHMGGSWEVTEVYVKINDTGLAGELTVTRPEPIHIDPGRSVKINLT